MRVLLCGTNYGSSYLRALQANEHGLTLAGVLARSDRSRELAAQCRVPFYKRVEDVPDKAIDLACVAISGDAGHAITTALLERGVHVLEEHPQRTAAVLENRAAARRGGAVYHINAHYSDIEAAAAFIAAYRATAQRSPILFVNVLTNARALYSAIEIVSRAAGPLQGITLTHTPAGMREFFSIARSGPLTIQMQTVWSVIDDGSANWVSHNITAGFVEGVLTLGEAHGPVTWAPAPPSLAQLQSPGVWNRPQWQVLAAPPPTFGDYVTRGRDRANRIALGRLVTEIHSGVTPPEQSDAHLAGVSEVWDAIQAAALAPHTNPQPASSPG